jgi:hypothetical protein
MISIMILASFYNNSILFASSAPIPEDAKEGSNDAIGTATYLGPGKYDNLAQWDDDYYYFWVASDTYINVTLTFDSSSSSCNLYMFDSAYFQVAQGTVMDSDTRKVSWFYTSTSSGTYYIKVNGSNIGEAYSLDIYSWKINPGDDGMEENDIQARAHPIVNNYTHSGLKDFDYDYYKFPVLPGDIIKGSIFHQSGGGSFYMSLYEDGNFASLSNSYYVSDTKKEITFTANFSGDMLILVYGSDVGDWYDLTVNLTRFDDIYEENDNQAPNNPLLTPNSYLNNLILHDNDWFRAPLSAGSCYTFNLTTNNSLASMKIFKGPTVLIKDAGWTSDTDLSFSISASATEDYFLEVYQGDVGTYNGSKYSLNMSYCQSSCADGDSLEPNNEQGTATLITGNQSWMNLELCSGGVDYFKYTSSGPKKITVKIHLIELNNLTAQIIDGGNQAIKNSTTSSLSNFKLSYYVPINYTLYVKLSVPMGSMKYDLEIVIEDPVEDKNGTSTSTDKSGSNTNSNSSVPADNPFGSIPGYSVQIVTFCMIFSIIAIIIKQKKKF